MKIKRFLYEDCKSWYHQLHNEIFDPDSLHIPAIVYVGFEDKNYIGFMSGYLHDARTFYVQKTGIPERHRNHKLSKELLNEIWERIRQDGFTALLGLVQNINTPTLIMALKSGWRVYGYRVSVDGKQYVEILKEL